MKDWIPLLQSLIWPVFIAAAAYRLRRPLRRFVESVNTRVEQGDPFEYEGPGGIIRLPPSSPQHPSGPEPRPGAQPLLNTELVPAGSETASADSADAADSDEPGPQIYVAHTARRDKSLDRENYRYHRVHVFLEGDDRDLDRVTKVVYHLHPTFYDPVRTVTDRATNFELRTSAWGMFNLRARVHVEDREEPLTLQRYLNF
ncbi:pYEATS domain-containing protein [Streptomyces marispadix]|uniref:YEATS domain-containing protein n=1 Tax=Streptomyces marispadix TaxID=2922868 RepID=A0ABS9T251_9ACTN|nr:pYEATS domain-containing protein [Streptomyces marispadix]MCH6162587.1 hypothetical protein [Streptomyces marispadix]